MEAKGLEPSNLLTASQQMYRPAGSTQYLKSSSNGNSAEGQRAQLCPVRLNVDSMAINLATFSETRSKTAKALLAGLPQLASPQAHGSVHTACECGRDS